MHNEVVSDFKLKVDKYQLKVNLFKEKLEFYKEQLNENPRSIFYMDLVKNTQDYLENIN